MKGKLVKVRIYTWASETFRGDPMRSWNEEQTHYVLCDSIHYSIVN